MQDVCGPASECERAAKDLLLDSLNTSESLGMERDHIVRSKVAIEFFRRKVRWPGLAGTDAVNDKIKILRECLDLRLISRFDAILDG